MAGDYVNDVERVYIPLREVSNTIVTALAPDGSMAAIIADHDTSRGGWGRYVTDSYALQRDDVQPDPIRLVRGGDVSQYETCRSTVFSSRTGRASRAGGGAPRVYCAGE
jgi:hypothetical protein